MKITMKYPVIVMKIVMKYLNNFYENRNEISRDNYENGNRL